MFYNKFSGIYRLHVLILLFVTIIFNTAAISQVKSQKWKFSKVPVWSDEFTEASLDTSKWSFEKGGDGWGNNELQYYTKGDNLYVENGILKITANKKNSHTNHYTSSRIVTKDKADWLYGKFIIKAKMPGGRGTWPALWMLPSKGYNAQSSENGEIDILEYVGFEKDLAHFSLHTESYNNRSGNEKTTRKKVKNAEEKFNIYRMDWTPYGIRGYVNGKKYFEYKNNSKGFKFWPFDKKFFLIINLAIGGDWGGFKGVDDKIFPATLEIDYVKVYDFLK